MHEEWPELPSFLLVANRRPLSAEQQARLAVWLKTPAKRSKRVPYDLPREMSPIAWALLREQQKAKAEKQKARLAALKERRRV